MTNKVAFNPQDRFLVTIGNTFVVATENGDVFGLDLSGSRIGDAFKFAGSKAAFNHQQDRFVVTMGGTLIVITQDGDVFGHDVSNRHVGQPFKFSGSRAAFNHQQDRFVLTMGNKLIVITRDGAVFGHDVSNRNVGQPFKFTGSRAAFNPQDRFVVTMANLLVITTRNGDAFGHTVSGRDVGAPSLLNPSAHLALDLAANPDHLQTNPELVIAGRGFASNGRFHYTIHNWPRIPDIHNQGAVSSDGSFSRTESRGFASIGFDVDVPDIQVTAVDESTGSSITASVSAERFVARHG